jgi:hypothetical protein
MVVVFSFSKDEVRVLFLCTANWQSSRVAFYCDALIVLIPPPTNTNLIWSLAKVQIDPSTNDPTIARCGTGHICERFRATADHESPLTLPTHIVTVLAEIIVAVPY